MIVCLDGGPWGALTLCACGFVRFRSWLLNQDPRTLDLRVVYGALLSTASHSQLGKLSDLLHGASTYNAERRAGHLVDNFKESIDYLVRGVAWVCVVNFERREG